MPPKRPSRAQATAEVLSAGRVIGAAAVVFHTAVAARQGLSMVEEKALDFLQRFGPLTAGELAQRSSLAPASITGLVDRLEKKGFVERIADPADRRKVRVRFLESSVAGFMPLFAGFVGDLQALCGKYTVDELAVIARFMREAAEIQQRAAAQLSGASEDA